MTKMVTCFDGIPFEVATIFQGGSTSLAGGLSEKKGTPEAFYANRSNPRIVWAQYHQQAVEYYVSLSER
jgi:hypothetical protein